MALVLRIRNMVIGAGRLLDFSGSYNRQAYGELKARSLVRVARSDTEALRSDWQAVGNDLRTAMNSFPSVNEKS